MTRVILERSYESFPITWEAFRSLLKISGTKFSKNLPAINCRKEITAAIILAAKCSGGSYLPAPYWEGPILIGNISQSLQVRLNGNSLAVVLNLEWINASPEGFTSLAAKLMQAQEVLEKTK